jgi:hypothetical protein
MSRLTGALIAVAALLAGAVVAVLVASGGELRVTQTMGVAGSLLAVIVGGIGIRQRRTMGRSGRGLAIAGLVLGIVGLALWLTGAASSGNSSLAEAILP